MSELRFHLRRLAIWLILSSVVATTLVAAEPELETDPPRWAQEAVWYQIFVERFRNGDPTNDPTVDEVRLAWPYVAPRDWAVTPWRQDWRRPDPWMAALDLPLDRGVQARRYGGDLAGVLEKLDYLVDLGVTAVYFNPLNDSPSLHKYDARCYRHIDRHFGPDPAGDAALLKRETPDNPSTWKWSEADRLFLRLIDEMHARDLRLIVDFSWNHTGRQFWAFQDVIEQGAESPYADWYEIDAFDDPATQENEFSYSGWAGVPELPRWKQIDLRPTPYRNVNDGDLHPEVKQHILNVASRWLDPNGDGDPSDGVDGFRLDVAAELPFGFWRDFRTHVKSINPQAILLGEIWWEQYPVKLRDPGPWLRGDMFDSVMHYRSYVAARGLFAGAMPRETPSTFTAAIREQHGELPRAFRRALMQLSSSHDTPRLATSLLNRGLYKYRSSPDADSDYKDAKPNAEIDAARRLWVLYQFTAVGAPCLYYGDEVGMWGADDPHCRKPMLWDDLAYEDETHRYVGVAVKSRSVTSDTKLRDSIERLIHRRRSAPEIWIYGEQKFLFANDELNKLVIRRGSESEYAYVAYNLSDREQTIGWSAPSGRYLKVEINAEETRNVADVMESLHVLVPAQTGVIVARIPR